MPVKSAAKKVAVKRKVAKKVASKPVASRVPVAKVAVKSAKKPVVKLTPAVLKKALPKPATLRYVRVFSAHLSAYRVHRSTCGVLSRVKLGEAALRPGRYDVRCARCFK